MEGGCPNCRNCSNRYFNCHAECGIYAYYEEIKKQRYHNNIVKQDSYPKKHAPCRNEHILKTHKHRPLTVDVVRAGTEEDLL